MAGRPQPKSRWWKPGNDPSKRRKQVPSMLDIAWAAGIYEGEGSVYGAQIHVTQKDPWLLKRLRRLFGGTIGARIKMGDTCAYRWFVSGARARGFALTIFTLLSPRRREQLRQHMFPVSD